jgi:hypothetical protein
VFERAGTGLRGGDHERCQRTGLGEGGAATFMVAAFMGPIAPVRWCYPCGMWWYAIFPATFALQALLVAVYVARAKRGKSSELLRLGLGGGVAGHVDCHRHALSSGIALCPGPKLDRYPVAEWGYALIWPCARVVQAQDHEQPSH